MKNYAFISITGNSSAVMLTLLLKIPQNIIQGDRKMTNYFMPLYRLVALIRRDLFGNINKNFTDTVKGSTMESTV